MPDNKFVIRDEDIARWIVGNDYNSERPAAAAQLLRDVAKHIMERYTYPDAPPFVVRDIHIDLSGGNATIYVSFEIYRCHQP